MVGTSMEIKSNDRLFITGKTNSGKTYWIRKHLDKLARFVFYDPKYQSTDLKGVFVETPQALDEALKQGQKRVFYRPFVINDDVFNEICRILYTHGNLTFIIDEMAFHVNSSQITTYHEILMRMGRSRGIGVWNCTQRTRSCCHNTILSETEHIICFKLMLETDRKKLTESFDPLFEKANELEEYHWIYYNTREDHARIMEPV